MELADTESRDTKSNVREWPGETPPSVKQWVSDAITRGVRVKVPCTDYNVLDSLRSAVTTEVRRNHPGYSAYTKERYDDQENLKEFVFTIGKSRRQRKTDAE